MTVPDRATRRARSRNSPVGVRNSPGPVREVRVLPGEFRVLPGESRVPSREFRVGIDNLSARMSRLARTDVPTRGGRVAPARESGDPCGRVGGSGRGGVGS